VLLQKLQENEQLKYELGELQSRLDSVTATVTPSTEELRPQPVLVSKARDDAASSRPHSFVPVTSAALENADGNNYILCQHNV